MKKIISMLVAMLMVVAMLPAATMAAGTIEYENVLLGYENFVMPDYNNANSGLWDASAEANKNRDGNYLFDKSMWLNNNANTVFTSGRFYVGTTGTYKVWMLSRDDVSTSTALSKENIPTIGIDNAEMRDGEAHDTLSWSATEWTIDAGWHSIYLGMKNSWKPVKINAIYITNNSEYTPNVSTHKELLEYKFNLTEPRTKWMLTWNNFVKPTYPTDHNNAWHYQTGGSLVDRTIYPNTDNTEIDGSQPYAAASNSARAKAQFYVEESGTYAVYMLSKPSAANRIPKMWVNDVQANSTAFHTDATWKWDKVVVSELIAGWNNVEFGLNAAFSPYSFNAIYITSDLTETVTTDNDDSLLAAYGDSSIKINGELYMACGLEKAGYAVEDSSINITPVKANATADSATVTIGGSATSWDTVTSIALNKGVNTVTVDSSDDSADCTFKVASTGKVINHRDTDASIAGGIESAIVGVDGVTNAVYLDSASSTAKFSAKNIEGKTAVYMYVVGAEGKDESVAADAAVVVADSNGETNKKPDTSRTTGSWISLGTYNFSGSEDEYVEIQGQDGANVYIDSVKFVYTDDYLVSAPVMVNADGKVKYTYECYKQTDNQAAPVAIIAEYDADTKVMNNVSVNNPSHNAKGFYTVSTNALDYVSGAEYRSFIWDSIGKLIPLR